MRIQNEDRKEIAFVRESKQKKMGNNRNFIMQIG